MSEENSMQTISRSIQILKSFTRENNEQSLAQFHHKLALSKSSLQRILNTLVTNGFLEKDNKQKTYKLGMELYYLGNLVEENSHLISTAKPYLKDLRDRLGENVYLNIIENNERKCIAIEEAKQLLMPISYVGQTSPLYAGASARVLLANLETNKMDDYIREIDLHSITEMTVKDKSSLKGDLLTIRENGYALSFGERIPGVCSASAPINRERKILASVSISAPIVRVNKETTANFIDAIKEVAKLITDHLTFVHTKV
jgi:IclR family KDG regulon transcriptional repressor